MKPSVVWCNRCIASHPEGEHKPRPATKQPAPPPAKAPPPPAAPSPPKDPMRKPVKKPKLKPVKKKPAARKRKARKTVPASPPSNVDIKKLPTEVAAIVRSDVRRRQLQAERARRYRKHQKKLEMEARA